MQLAVVIPIGPVCRPEFVRDTVESIEHYCVSDHRIVLVDDSQLGTGREVGAGRDRITVVETPESRGNRGGLYLSLSQGIAVALREPADVLLRLDTDALVCGSGWEQRAVDLFAADARLASLGHYRFTPNGEARNYDYAAQRIASALSLRGLASKRDPRAWRRVKTLVADADRNGYARGEAVMGGIAVYRPAALQNLARRGLLGDPALLTLGIEEDQIFGLTLRASGWTLGEFGSDHDDLPMYARHQGLPAHPTEILAKHKALVHSTRQYDSLDEAAIRAVFREARSAAGAPA